MTVSDPLNPRFESPGIVSVNDRGGTGSDLARKLTFLVVVAGTLTIGVVFAFNRYRASEKAHEAETQQSAKAETKPAQVGPKRVFESEGKVAQKMPTAPDPLSAATPVPAPCKEVTILDGNGKPMAGKDGLPIRIGCDGKRVPAIDPNVAVASGTAPVGAAGAAPAKAASRFAGDVILPGATMTVQASPQPTPQSQSMAELHRLLRPDPGAPSASAPFPSTAAPVPPAPPTAGVANSQGAVAPLLTGTHFPKVTASRIGDRNLLLAKGAQIDCALSTRLVNEVSGFASCILTSNVYSDNGKVLLLERGSEAHGEYTATVANGQRRLFVLWQRIRTPSGVVITLDSPAADGLGTMGLDGHLDNRWFDRIGAAFLLSFVKDAIAYEIARSSNGANSNASGLAYQNTTRTGEQMAERILASTINIKPTLYKNQGDRASIYVARDLDFSTVYALRPR